MIKLYYNYADLMSDVEVTKKYPTANYPNAFAEYKTIKSFCDNIKKDKFSFSLRVKRHNNIYFIKYFTLDNEVLYKQYDIFGIKI